VKRNLKLPWIALLLYATSFFLPSIQVLGAGLPGWVCARFALHQLGGHDNTFSKPSVFGFAVLASGLMNPMFVAALFLAPSKKHERLARIVRLGLLVMVPCSWIVFYFLFRQHIYIREGYVVWLASIILLVVSIRTGEVETQRKESAPGWI